MNREQQDAAEKCCFQIWMPKTCDPLSILIILFLFQSKTIAFSRSNYNNSHLGQALCSNSSPQWKPILKGAPKSICKSQACFPTAARKSKQRARISNGDQSESDFRSAPRAEEATKCGRKRQASHHHHHHAKNNTTRWSIKITAHTLSHSHMREWNINKKRHTRRLFGRIWFSFFTATTPPPSSLSHQLISSNARELFFGMSEHKKVYMCAPSNHIRISAQCRWRTLHLLLLCGALIKSNSVIPRVVLYLFKVLLLLLQCHFMSPRGDAKDVCVFVACRKRFCHPCALVMSAQIRAGILAIVLGKFFVAVSFKWRDDSTEIWCPPEIIFSLMHLFFLWIAWIFFNFFIVWACCVGLWKNKKINTLINKMEYIHILYTKKNSWGRATVKKKISSLINFSFSALFLMDCLLWYAASASRRPHAAHMWWCPMTYWR